MSVGCSRRDSYQANIWAALRYNALSNYHLVKKSTQNNDNLNKEPDEMQQTSAAHLNDETFNDKDPCQLSLFTRF